MSKVLIDFEKIKDPFSGLGQFCSHLKPYFDKDALPISYWIPDKFEKLAKKIPFLRPSCKVFHAIHQDSPYYPRSKKATYILTIHDLNALYETTDESKKVKYKAELQKKIDRAIVITFISQFTKSEVERTFTLEGKKTEVIYNGISMPQMSRTPAFIPDSKFIFAIGTVLPKKNFHTLIDFLKLLPQEYKIVLAGTTYHAYAQQMQQRINAEGLGHRFFLIGTIHDEEKRWYYENACAFIFPSLLEGFGLPVAEAMSMGLPLFLSDKTSVPEIGGPDAYYFKDFTPAHMAQVFEFGMKDFSLERKLRLIERSKIFSWQAAANQYLKIYKQFV